MRQDLRSAIASAFACATLCSSLHAAEIAAVVRTQDGGPVSDAVIVAVPVDGGIKPPARPSQEVVDQIDREFVPRVTVVAAGTSVRFPNKDNVRHHVYSFSPAKKFELPLYAGTPAAPVVFDKPGLVVLGCNIHDWMIGYIYVSESPYYAKTGSDGRALLRDLPERSYTVRVWHPQLEGAEPTARADLERSRRAELAWVLKLKPDFRPHRVAPGRSTGRY